MASKISPAVVFSALGDEHRLEMLEYVATGELRDEPAGPGICSCHIQAEIGLSQPTVSHHMKLLSDARLVVGEKRGKWVYYRLNPEGFALIEQIAGRYLKLAARPPRLRRSATS
jgi:ArsR family transcriptional regulator, arsenate/arsenite/antimonite-responsive transcriptional repressor